MSLTRVDILFDAIDWHLVLYENGKVGYDQTIRDIIVSARRNLLPCPPPPEVNHVSGTPTFSFTF